MNGQIQISGIAISALSIRGVIVYRGLIIILVLMLSGYAKPGFVKLEADSDQRSSNTVEFNNGWDAFQHRDYLTALEKWKPLAEEDYAKAQYNLGIMYNKGWGVLKDLKVAIKWFKLAAGQGYVPAQYSLGIMYYEGTGVPNNYSEAILWFRKAAVQGYAKAQYNLGVMYNKGLGVLKDYRESVSCFKLAAGQGYVPAQYNLGVMYANGLGVSQDYTRALMWWNIAALHGHEYAKKNRDTVQNVITPADVSKANELTRECIAKNYKGC